MGKFDTANINGDRLCAVVGCRKHKKITYIYGDFFCNKHILIMTNIRARIIHSIPPTEDEIKARVEEQCLRKTRDRRHIHYLAKW